MLKIGDIVSYMNRYTNQVVNPDDLRYEMKVLAAYQISGLVEVETKGSIQRYPKHYLCQVPKYKKGTHVIFQGCKYQVIEVYGSLERGIKYVLVDDSGIKYPVYVREVYLMAYKKNKCVSIQLELNLYEC